jgi:hypothetical protein
MEPAALLRNLGPRNRQGINKVTVGSHSFSFVDHRSSIVENTEGGSNQQRDLTFA